MRLPAAAAGDGYKKEIDLSGPTGTIGRVVVMVAVVEVWGGDGKFHL